MGSKFISTSDGDLRAVSDGTLDILGASLGSQNLTPGFPIKIDSERKLYSTALAINDVVNLQDELDATIKTPYSGVIKASDFETGEYLSANAEFKQIENITNLGNKNTNIDGMLHVTEVKTDRIYDAGGNVFIDMNETDINFSATNLTFNGNQIGIGEELRENLDLNGFDITGVGISGLQTVNGMSSIINANQAKVVNIESAVENVETKFYGNLIVGNNTESETWSEGGRAGELLKLKNGNMLYAGLNAGMSSSGIRNLLIGENCGTSLLTGNTNLALGVNTLQYTLGSFNVALGSHALRGSTGNLNNTSQNNVAIGWASMFASDTSRGNVAIGLSAGSGIVDGNDNVMIGLNANLLPTDNNSTNCVVIGENAHSSGGTNRIAIGSRAIATNDNQAMIGDDNITELVNGGNGTCDLGSVTNAFKDFHISGKINEMTATGGVFNGISDSPTATFANSPCSLLPVSSVGNATLTTFKAGDMYQVRLGGILTCTANAMINITILANTSARVYSQFRLSESTNRNFNLDFVFTIRDTDGALASNGTFSYIRDNGTTIEGVTLGAVTTFDPNGLSVDVEADWIATDDINSLTCQSFSIYKIY